MSLLKALYAIIFSIIIHFPIKAQICATTFQKTYLSNNGIPINAKGATIGANGDLILCGNYGSSGMIVRYNSLEKIKWAKQYRYNYNVNFLNVAETADEGIIVAGTFFDGISSALLISKLNMDGQIIWTKRFKDVSSAPGLKIKYSILEDIKATSDGGVVVCGRKACDRLVDQASNYRPFLFKLNKDGSISWSKENSMGNDDEAYNMIVDKGTVFVVGRSALNGITYGFLENVDEASGITKNIWLYNTTGTDNESFRSIAKTSKGFEIGSQGFKSFVSKAHIYYMVKLRDDGTILSYKKLPGMATTFVEPHYNIVPLSGGGGSVIWRDDLLANGENNQLYKVDASMQYQWGKVYRQSGAMQINSVLATNDGGVLGVGTINNSVINLIKTGADGKTGGCEIVDSDLELKDSLSYQRKNVTKWNLSLELNFEAPFDLSVSVSDVNLTSNELCSSTCQVDRYSISGDSIICVPDGIKTYSIRQLATCALPVKWNLTNSIGEIQYLNDSSINVHFKSAGRANLEYEFKNGCNTIHGSFQINYSPTNSKINIGNDTTICKGDTLKLSTNEKFKYTFWSDGSKSDALNVFKEGSYSVSVSMDSVCFIRDTIKIYKVYPKPEIRFPQNPVICKPQPFTLDAGIEAISYNWQDGSGGKTFIVKDTGLYWVSVVDANNCKASDSISIVKTGVIPTNFAAFKDTAICNGEPIVLYTSTPFKNYNWNKGLSLNSTLAVNKPGNYTIEVLNNDGCKGIENIIVKDKFCKEAIFVPNSFTPDQNGRNDVFKATVIGFPKEYKLRIYNRWGQLIYETDKASEGWDGKYRSILQNGDTYIWTIDYKFENSDNLKHLKGWVILIR